MSAEQKNTDDYNSLLIRKKNKMMKEVVATGKDVAEAKENARAALGAGPLDDVKFEVLYTGSRGIFGIIGVKPAQVRAYIELPDREETRRRPAERRADKPAEAAAEQTAGKDTGDASAKERTAENRRKKNVRRRRPETGRPPRFTPPAEPAKPKSEVIPECELKFERREVADGVDMSYDFIKGVLNDTGLDAVAELYSCDDGTRRITITGKDASVLIGHHGDTLDALQYLANLASAHKNANGERDKSRVTIDVEGYRAKREETLRALARRMADKALRNRRSVMLEPMSAYERRIIHSEVQKIEGVSTSSIGTDNNRRIVIYLTDKKPKEIPEDDEERVTDLKEEFAPDADTLDIESVEVSVPVDESDSEVVAIEQTIPVEEAPESPVLREEVSDGTDSEDGAADAVAESEKTDAKSGDGE